MNIHDNNTDTMTMFIEGVDFSIQDVDFHFPSVPIPDRVSLEEAVGVIDGCINSLKRVVEGYDLKNNEGPVVGSIGLYFVMGALIEIARARLPEAEREALKDNPGYSPESGLRLVLETFPESEVLISHIRHKLNRKYWDS